MPETTPPGSLAEALAALQGQLPHVGKDAENPHFKSKYADLETITAALLPVLSGLGLSFSARPDLGADGVFALHWILRHVSGESDSGLYPLPASGSPQQIGGAITYARRYALCAITGLAPGGDDDDGNAAEQAHQAAPQRKPRTVPDKQLASEGRMTRGQARDHERLEADVRKRKPGEQKAARGGRMENDPWETRPPEERENEPGTANQLQTRAIWMLLKQNNIEDREVAHTMAAVALGIERDSLADPDTGEVTFNRLSHAQAAEFIKQLQDG